ncbi:MAG: glycosyltransferase family 39 protein [Lachnospiraceae bacterium]|nr:glycosyltransferase family 39 protein [Lachnospiraceae bacterium]
MMRREIGIIVVLFLAVVLFLFFLRKKKINVSGSLIVTLITSIAIHAFYIAYTPTWERQHDVIGFENGKGIGQAAYIEWFFDHWSLPDFDPRKKWGFFQPAFHHITAAIWLKINTMIGFGYTAATENIQVLTLIYCLILAIFALRIFKLMRLEGRSLEIAFALTALHPLYILLSGSVNNDTLCTLLMIMTCYYALKWENKNSWPDIIKTALCMGLSMMTKLSGVLIAPALAWIFIINWIVGGKKNFFKYLRQYLVFALISVPIGMFFPMRNLLLFGVPLNYTPKVGEELIYGSVLSRFTDLYTNTPFAAMIKNGDSFDEYNIILAGLKTSLTGEFNFADANRFIIYAAWILFISGALLMLLTIISVFRVTFSKKTTMSLQIRVFWSILYLTAIAFFLNLCLSIPNFSSQDFRYIAYLLVPNALFIGLNRQNSGVWMRIFITSTSMVFLISSLAVYFLLGA